MRKLDILLNTILHMWYSNHSTEWWLLIHPTWKIITPSNTGNEKKNGAFPVDADLTTDLPPILLQLDMLIHTRGLLHLGWVAVPSIHTLSLYKLKYKLRDRAMSQPDGGSSCIFTTITHIHPLATGHGSSAYLFRNNKCTLIIAVALMYKVSTVLFITMFNDSDTSW